MQDWVKQGYKFGGNKRIGGNREETSSSAVDYKAVRREVEYTMIINHISTASVVVVGACNYFW
jgi:hypothetical protein